MRYFIIAGEPSGDLHGANLIKGLKKSDPKAEFRFCGGDKMSAEAGVEARLLDYRQMSFFGIFQVIANLRTILGQIRLCKDNIKDFQPDALILIDYPSFNMRMAKFAHGLGISTFYYIAPKVWAWKEWRVKSIRKWVDRLFIIFPFEIEYFKNKGVQSVIFEGNPLCDAIEEQVAQMPTREEFYASAGLDTRPKVALLAGSRRSEIDYNLPLMVALSDKFPDYEFVLAGVPWLDRALYDKYLDEAKNIKFVCDATYTAVRYAEAAVVTSGTATLETALLGTPEVVCYRTHPLYCKLKPYVLKVKYVSLVNLILDREAVRELIQADLGITQAEAELRTILVGGAKRDEMLSDFAELRQKVGGAGASERFARKTT